MVCEGASNFLNNIFVFIYCKLFRKSMIQWGLGEVRGKKRGTVRKLLDPLIRPIERRANAIICYSTYGKEYYRSLGIADEKLFVAVNVVDTDKRLREIRECDSLNAGCIRRDNNFNIVFVGAMEPNKRIDVLLKTLSQLVGVQESLTSPYRGWCGETRTRKAMPRFRY